MPIGEFVEDIKKMLREWEWPPWKINEEFPKILAAFVEVGILRSNDQGFELTGRVADDMAWQRAWDLLEKGGVTELGGSAS